MLIWVFYFQLGILKTACANTDFVLFFLKIDSQRVHATFVFKLVYNVIIDDAIINPGLTQQSINSFTNQVMTNWGSKDECFK